MGRRKRAKSAMAKGSTFMGVPFDAITECAKIHEHVHLRIHRRDAKGRFASIGSITTMKTVELASIEDFIKNKAGGGTFLVQPMRVDNVLEAAMTKFEVGIEGPPKPVTAKEHGVP